RPVPFEVVTLRLGIDRITVLAELRAIFFAGEFPQVVADLLVGALDDNVTGLAIVFILEFKYGFIL
ncbi:MAG: hypothetical protein OEU09_22675, partial [Rhodospirillales bacterium]|nr:hypothetical protein [Rhodospirillales bacterium]